MLLVLQGEGRPDDLRHLKELAVFGLFFSVRILVGKQAGGDAQGFYFFSDAQDFLFFNTQNFFDRFHDRSLGRLDLGQLHHHVY